MQNLIAVLRRALTGDHDQTASERVIGKDKNQPRQMPAEEIGRILRGDNA